jgi:succinate dehydrogenase / fumarate reductase cytochrome b subunit
MSQVRTDAQGAEAQQRAGPRGSADRPISPHLQVWRWHVTMATSIFHRASGMALYFGALILAGWAIALASGPDAYGAYMSLLGSIVGKLVMFGLTLALTYHFANGIRHLIWDLGAGLNVKSANASGWFAIVIAVVAAVAIWVVAYFMGVL